MARRAPTTDPLVRGELSLRHHGVAVRLVAGHGVFSAPSIDPGTRFLLRWLATDPGVAAARRVLDVGCGYGPLGLWLAAAGGDDRTVVAVDRDAVAVECTVRGAEANGVANRVTALGSLGYDDVDGRFDLIVSNIPAKVGSAALRHLLLDAAHRLDLGVGIVAVVVVDRHADEVGEILGVDGVEVLTHHRNRSYASWTYRFDEVPESAEPSCGFERGVYRRGAREFSAGGLTWSAATSFALPEFDTLNHATAAAVELLAATPMPGPVAVVGVGQGHTPLALRAVVPAAALRLIDRDLLALRTAVDNLGEVGVEARHSSRPAGQLAGCASAVAAIPEKQPVGVTAALLSDALGELPAGAPVLLHGRAADVSRVSEMLEPRLTPRARRGRPGYAATISAVRP